MTKHAQIQEGIVGAHSLPSPRLSNLIFRPDTAETTARIMQILTATMKLHAGKYTSQ